jgi:hypothetical protein
VPAASKAIGCGKFFTELKLATPSLPFAKTLRINCFCSASIKLVQASPYKGKSRLNRAMGFSLGNIIDLLISRHWTLV